MSRPGTDDRPLRVAVIGSGPAGFYTAQALRREVLAAGLQIRACMERPVLPGRSLVVAGWVLERDA